jgi:hypothetical protein
MGMMMADVSWIFSCRNDDGRYDPDFHLGSEADDGRHLRGTSGWPYSIYRRATDIGVTDAVLCCGIQNLADAKALLALVNANVPVPIAKQLHDAA